MRWTPKKYPELGDKRTVRRFAWLPVDIGIVTVWLESYWSHEVYDEVMVGGFTDMGLYWHRRWVPEKRELMGAPR